jgi:hypothetical protein
MAPVLEGKFNWLGPKNSAKRRASDFGRTQESIKVKDSICFMFSPNWFLGNWTLDPCLKRALAKELNSLLTQYGVSGVVQITRLPKYVKSKKWLGAQIYLFFNFLI